MQSDKIVTIIFTCGIMVYLIILPIIGEAYWVKYIKTKDIKHVAMIGVENVLAKVILAKSEDKIQGFLVDDDIHVSLDLGPSVNIYKDRLRKIFFQEGYRDLVDLSKHGIQFAGLLGLHTGGFTSSFGAKFVLIQPGSFKMGSTNHEHEGPIHSVNITKPFFMGVTEVTQAQWEKVMGFSFRYGSR